MRQPRRLAGSRSPLTPLQTTPSRARLLRANQSRVMHPLTERLRTAPLRTRPSRARRSAEIGHPRMRPRSAFPRTAPTRTRPSCSTRLPPMPLRTARRSYARLGPRRGCRSSWSVSLCSSSVRRRGWRRGFVPQERPVCQPSRRLARRGKPPWPKAGGASCWRLFKYDDAIGLDGNRPASSVWSVLTVPRPITIDGKYRLLSLPSLLRLLERLPERPRLARRFVCTVSRSRTSAAADPSRGPAVLPMLRPSRSLAAKPGAARNRQQPNCR